MALGQILSLPSTSNGDSASAPSIVPAWSTFAYRAFTAGLTYPIYIIGVSYIFEGDVLPDTTVEVLIDIALGPDGSEVSKIQIPYSYREETGAGYYQQSHHNIFLPEPVFVPANTRISYTIGRSPQVSTTYTGVKLFYQEGGISSSASTNFLAFFNN